MAKEISVITEHPAGRRGTDWEILFLVDVSAAPIQANGITVVVSHSSTLPDEVSLYNILTQIETDALDVGDMIFSTSRQNQPKGMTKAAMLAKVRQYYNDTVSVRVQELRDRYASTGTRVNA
jgi:hypothetical protein